MFPATIAIALAYMSLANGNEHSLVSQSNGSRSPVSQIFQKSCLAGDIDKQGHKWTSEPFCISVDSPESVLCVYTDTKFANGRGISIIAQPSMARKLCKHPMLQTPGLTIQSSGNHANLSEQYEMRNLPGRGIGVIATQTLERGSLLISETPIIAFQQDAMTMPRTLDDLFLLHRTAVERLPPQSQDLYMSMDDGGFTTDPYGDRFETNAFSVLDYVLLFPKIARINHDCRPNVQYFFDRKSFSNQIHVSRTINPGEEITGSYISHDMSFKERSDRLRDQWGFNCACSLCSASKADVAESDRRIARMKVLKDSLADLSPGRNASTATAQELISMYEQENIQGPIVRAYEYAALEYSYVGHKGMVQKYAALAVESGRIWLGPFHPDVRNMLELFHNPEGHPSWKLRE